MALAVHGGSFLPGRFVTCPDLAPARGRRIQKEHIVNPDFLRRFLLGSLVVNYVILLIWFLAFVLARQWMRGLHTRWFRLSDDSFDAIHYGGMAVYKIGILLFNLAPLLALYFMGRGS